MQDERASPNSPSQGEAECANCGKKVTVYRDKRMPHILHTYLASGQFAGRKGMHMDECGELPSIVICGHCSRGDEPSAGKMADYWNPREGKLQPTKDAPRVFGYCMGQSITEEPEGRNANGMLYITEKHSVLDEVSVYWTPAAGVCLLRGVYRVPSPDNYGQAHKAAFDMLTGLVMRKYGEPSDIYDFLHSGSIWNEPNDWLGGLECKERVLSAFWDGNKGLPAELSAISVDAEESFIVVTYQFANFDEGNDEGARLLADDF